MYVTERAVKEQNLFYHYTNKSNFESIIDSGDLWVSEFRSMNDYAEIETALDELRLLCVQLAEPGTLGLSTWNQIRNIFMQDFQCFIFSLAMKRDSLSMFRAYSGADGVSIGFPVPLFLEGLDGNWTIGEAQYDKLSHIAALKPLADKICSILKNSTGEIEIYAKIELLRDEFRQIAPFLKNYGFHEEQEIRLFTSGKGMKQYTRKSRDGIDVKYVKLSWLNCLVQSVSADFAIDTLIVSPGPNINDRMKDYSVILGDRQRKFRAIYQSMTTAIL
jgi:hypothetical protein